MSYRNTSHRRALEKIALHPKEFGIERVIYSAIEPNLFDKGRLIAKPDIVFYCIGGEIHIIEYKANGNGELLERADTQLRNATFWFGKYIKMDSEKIHTRILTGEDLTKKLKFYSRK